MLLMLSLLGIKTHVFKYKIFIILTIRYDSIASTMPLIYKPNRIKNDIISEKSPIASDKAKPRIAYENSCGLRDGFRA